MLYVRILLFAGIDNSTDLLNFSCYMHLMGNLNTPNAAHYAYSRPALSPSVGAQRWWVTSPPHGDVSYHWIALAPAGHFDDL